MRSRGSKGAIRARIMGGSHIGGMLSWGNSLKIEVIAEIQGIIRGIIGKGTNRMGTMDNTMKTPSMALKFHKTQISPFVMNFSREKSVHMARIVKGSINSSMSPYRK